MLILCSKEGPGPRVLCAGGCGEVIVLDPYFGPSSRAVCVSCASVELTKAIVKGEPARFAAKEPAMAAMRLFLAPTSGQPS